MKVLWFSNRLFTEEKITGTGTWLVAMSDALVKSGEVELFNITKGDKKKIEKVSYNGIKQWKIPNIKPKRNGLPPQKIISDIQKIVDEIKPDIIHIWGTESYWGLLTARGLIKGMVLLEIQGLVSQIKRNIYSGLRISEIIRCIGFKEILKPSLSLPGKKIKLEKLSKFEIEIINNHSNISTQSDWVRSFVKYTNRDASIFNTKIQLRKEFLQSCNNWDYINCNKYSIYTSATTSQPFKGLHVLIDAIALLKISYPEIKLNIAGQVSKGIRQSGYTKFLMKKIKKLGLVDNVIWLGALNAEEIVNKLKESHISVVPSFIESYCAVLQESITLGIPVVASFAGAMPELGKGNKMVKYFSPGDVFMCAREIECIFTDKNLAATRSDNSISESSNLATEDITNLQLSFYKNLLLKV